MKKLLITLALLMPLSAYAKQEVKTDSIKTQQLDDVVVEACNQRLGADVSTYIPTSKQKNAS